MVLDVFEDLGIFYLSGAMNQDTEGIIMKWRDVVSREPDIVSGALVFAGTRVPVEILIDYFKAGESLDRFLEGFPTVKREQAEAFLEAALESAVAGASDANPA